MHFFRYKICFCISRPDSWIHTLNKDLSLLFILWASCDLLSITTSSAWAPFTQIHSKVLCTPAWFQWSNCELVSIFWNTMKSHNFLTFLPCASSPNSSISVQITIHQSCKVPVIRVYICRVCGICPLHRLHSFVTRVMCWFNKLSKAYQ